MWFNNIIAYQYELSNPIQEEALAENYLKPCPPHARFIYGWSPVFADMLIQNTTGCSLICMGKEERVLPRGVIQRVLEERILQLETERGQPVKRAEKKQLAETLEFELLPQSFCLRKRLPALLDQMTKRIFINTASSSQASQLLSLLRKSTPIQFEPIKPIDNISMRLANWITEPTSLPSAFELSSSCLLFSPDDTHKRVNCRGYELPAEEVLALLTQGLAVAELSLVWQDRVQFTITQDFVLKRIKCLDLLADNFNEVRHLEDEMQQRDASLILLADALREMTNDLFKALSLEAHPAPSENRESIMQLTS